LKEIAVQLREAFECFIGRQSDEVVITSAGSTSMLWWRLTHDMDRVFYLGASMGMASMFAAGIALGATELPVWVFEGDGGFAMNPGALMVQRDLSLPNLKHFLVSNRRYVATGARTLPNAAHNDYAGLARSMGIDRVFSVADRADLERDFDGIVRERGYTFTVLEIEPTPASTTSDPPNAAEPRTPFGRFDDEARIRFGRYVERVAGIKIFDYPYAPPRI
jgi:thiamine pyrophosphate-dependent acetolactate synthase large subunit-like protein